MKLHRLLPAAAAIAAAACSTSLPLPPVADAPPPAARVAVANADPLGENVVPVSTAGGFYEASVAVSRVDPRKMVIGVVGTVSSNTRTNFVFRSEDAGLTWSEGSKMRVDGANGRIYARSGDPVVAADRHGRFYSASLVTQTGFTAIGVSYSDDGVTWSQPTIVTEVDKSISTAFDDKEWLAVDDTGGPFDGNVYVFWQKMEKLPSAPSIIYFARSRDRGLTWDEPMPLTAPAYSGTSLIDVGPDGEIYVIYMRAGEGYLSRVSWDGGASFSEPLQLIPPTALAGGPVDGTAIRFPGFPHLVVDRSDGPHRGNAYFVHLMNSRRPDGTSAKAIGVSRSIDRGLTWSAEREISASSAGDAFFPMAAVDRSTGDLVVAWYDRRDSPGAARAKIRATRSTDGGSTYEPPRAVTGEFSLQTSWIGDYYSLAAARGHWVAIFSDGPGRLYAAHLDFGQTKSVPFTPPRRRAIRP